VTVYETTDWLETVEDGWNVLADPEDADEIVRAIKSRPAPKRKSNHYGNGQAGPKIVEIINRYLGRAA
jgi:UDP-N-acetylglucosamine 2-epimerase (non-hydrolysing)